MCDIPVIKLNTGTKMPSFGFGTWQAEEGDEAKNSVLDALKAGYRLIDTAAIYGNEGSVGKAVKESGLPRDEIFLTTKLWNDDQGYNNAFKAFDNSLQRLGLEYVDLYLIHWPTPGKQANIDSWKALIKLQKDGLTRAIGVSNFKPEQIQAIVDATGVVPSVNQIKFNPFVYSEWKETFDYCKQNGIIIEAYSPLARAADMDNPTIGEIGNKHKKTSAQIMLRWALQHGTVPIPKSVHLDRIKENLNVFNFELSDKDMRVLNELS